jgi:type II secretory pathway pseudopilin PulG
MMAIRGNRTTLSAGYTLAEMLGVVLILAISAAAVLPGLSQSDKSKVELAASEVAGALRFAREEALRRSAPTVVVLSGIARVQAFELDVSDPLNPTLGPPLYHPLDKDAYDLDLHILPFSEGVKASSNLPSGPSGGDNAIGFNARGEPLNASNLTGLSDRHVDVSFGSRTRRVRITAVTARISEAWH